MLSVKTPKTNGIPFHFLFLKKILFIAMVVTMTTSKAQNNIVTYAGNNGKETFYDVVEISNGTFLVCGYADNLNWIAPNVPKNSISYTGTIPNAQDKNRYGFILQLSSHLYSILHVVHFPQDAVEYIGFNKTNSKPYQLWLHFAIIK